jgi:riboflavin biosynthesis pyrimidine reductase
MHEFRTLLTKFLRENHWTQQKLAGQLDADQATVSRWLSGTADLLHTHRMRALADAVLVGVNTVLHDDPQLTVRRCAGSNPLRVVIDPERRLDGSQRIFHDSAAPTLLLRRLHGDLQPLPAMPPAISRRSKSHKDGRL